MDIEEQTLLSPPPAVTPPPPPPRRRHATYSHKEREEKPFNTEEGETAGVRLEGETRG